MVETNAHLVSPRAAALVCQWAIRYAAGRGTGIFTDVIRLAHTLADHLTCDERDSVLAEAERALAISRRKDQSGSLLANGGETADWERLIDELHRRDGAGSDTPVDVGTGRMLALCANSAARRVTGYDWSSDEPDEDTHRQVAQAIAAVAAQFSPGDRVLVMRDLHERDQQLRRSGEGTEGLGEPWRELYRTLAGMELHEDSRRWERLPDTLDVA